VPKSSDAPLGQARCCRCTRDVRIRDVAMSISARLLHSAWAGYWTFTLVWFSVRHFSWSWLRAEPQISALPLFACVWLPFAIGLWFERRWAWVGAFALSVLSLFVALYIACFAVSAATHEGWQHRSWLEFVWVIPAMLVVAALLHTRHAYSRESRTETGVNVLPAAHSKRTPS